MLEISAEVIHSVRLPNYIVVYCCSAFLYMSNFLSTPNLNSLYNFNRMRRSELWNTHPQRESRLSLTTQPMLVCSNKLRTSLKSIGHLTILLANSLQLSTQSDSLQFSRQTPYSSPLDQTSYNSPNKLLTALHSVRHLTILLTNSLQLSTRSDILQFS